MPAGSLRRDQTVINLLLCDQCRPPLRAAFLRRFSGVTRFPIPRSPWRQPVFCAGSFDRMAVAAPVFDPVDKDVFSSRSGSQTCRHSPLCSLRAVHAAAAESSKSSLPTPDGLFSKCRSMSGKTERSRSILSLTPALVFLPCAIGRPPARTQKQTSGWTSKTHGWHSGVIASSTCLIFGAIPQACWLKPLPVIRKFVALASA